MAWVFSNDSATDLQSLSRKNDIAVKLFRVCCGFAKASRLGPQLGGFEHGFGIEWQEDHAAAQLIQALQ